MIDVFKTNWYELYHATDRTNLHAFLLCFSMNYRDFSVSNSEIITFDFTVSKIGIS